MGCLEAAEVEAAEVEAEVAVVEAEVAVVEAEVAVEALLHLLGEGLRFLVLARPR